MKNRVIKKCWISVLLALAITATGCEASQPIMTAAVTDATTPEPTEKAEKIKMIQESYYVTDYTEVSYRGGDRYEFQCVAPDGYYATRKEVTETFIGPDGETEEVISTCLYHIGYDGKIKRLKNFEPLSFETEFDENFSVEGFCTDQAGNLAVLEEEFRCWSEAPEGTPKYSEPWYAQYVQVEQYYIRQLDEKGEEISRAYLQDPTGTGYIYLHDPVRLDKDQFLVVCDGTGICAYDMQGNIEYVIPLDGTVETLTSMGTEQVAALVQRNGEKYLVLLDTQTKSQKNECKMSDTAYGIVCGTDIYDFYYTDNGNFFGGTFDGTAVMLLRWIDCAVDSGFIADCKVAEDGTIVCFADEWNEKFRNSETGITTLKYMSAEEAETTDITLGTLNTTRSLNNLIMDYNRTNEGGRIILRDYSQYGEQAAVRMRSDLMDAEGPDLLDLNGLDTEELKKAGLLENLLPYLESEQIMLVNSAEKAAENDGALYVAIQEFQANVTLNAQPAEETKNNPAVQFDITVESGDHLLRLSALADGITELEGYTFTVDETEANVSTAEVSLAMCAASENKDAVWKFLRNYFTEEYQADNSSAFPTNEQLFDSMLWKLQEPAESVVMNAEEPEENAEAVTEAEENETLSEENGNKPLYTITCGETTVSVYPLTEEQTDFWYNLIEKATPMLLKEETENEAIPNETDERQNEIKEHLREQVYEILNGSTDQ